MRKLASFGFSRGTFNAPLIVFLGGINLILIQWIMVRELTMLLLGTELVILIVTAAYFLGLSVGYALSGKVKRSWLPALAMLTLILHLTLPVMLRLLSGWLYEKNIFWVAFIVLPLLVPFTVSAFYSILLPLYIDDGKGSLIALYSIELAGAMLGVILLILVGNFGVSGLYIPYSLILFVILMALGIRWILLIPLAIAATVWLLAFPSLERTSNAYWFGKVFELQNPITVFSSYSPYQKVDIIEDSYGSRYLFLNGLIDYGTPGWNRLNVALGEVPARLIKPRNMATVGSGSMALEGLTAEYVGHITTVELDPVVLNASREHFDYINGVNKLPNWSFVIDDAKHFFANTQEQFDLVTMNVPAPLTGQTATLYSSAFYGMIKAKLAPHGVLAVSLTRQLRPGTEVARRIAAGVLENFENVIAVTPESVGLTFVYASDDLPFTMKDVEAMLHDVDEAQYTILDKTALQALVSNAEPITTDDLSIALGESLRRIKDLLEPHQ